MGTDDPRKTAREAGQAKPRAPKPSDLAQRARATVGKAGERAQRAKDDTRGERGSARGGS